MPRLLDTQTTTAPDGRTLVAMLFQSPGRASGRRIVVRHGATTLFDTDDCFDLGNAVNKLDRWAAENLKPVAQEAA